MTSTFENAIQPPNVEIVKASRHAIVHSNVGPERGQIDGVVVAPLTSWPDDRGFFAEVFRDTQDVMKDFTVRQSSITMTRPGVIKAFHFHNLQDDIFCPIVGAIRIALVDLRKDSPTHGFANSVFCGERNLRAVRIPRGVAHGYEVLPPTEMQMVYYTNQHYNPDDEVRFEYDDPAIDFRWWGIQNR